MTVEYIVTYEITKGFLNSVTCFNNLLMTNSDIKVTNQDLIYCASKFGYEVLEHEIIEKNQRIFKIVIDLSHSQIDDAHELLKMIRDIVYKTRGQISIVWDGISHHYSTLAYPKINEIENLLRKLITYFMLSQLGSNWSDISTPIEIKISKKKDNRSVENFLHDTDFIQLADYLFKPYTVLGIDQLFKELKNRIDLKNLKIDYFQNFIPRSNWERYFNKFVDCEDGYFNKNWNRLYDVRCLIAHNSFISKVIYEEALEIINNLNEYLTKAIDAVDQIVISAQDKKALISNTALLTNDLLDSYFQNWKQITDAVKDLYIKNGFEIDMEFKMGKAMRDLKDAEILSEEFYNDLAKLALRNKQYRDRTIPHNTVVLKAHIEELNNFYIYRILFENPFF